MNRVLSIQDISCLGKCSLTVALPVISAMGQECAILPTALLSTHTVFQGFTCKDLSDQIAPIAAHWKSQNIKFDTIYTGYLATAPQVDQICNFIDQFQTDETLIFVDPAMGDQGHLYTGFPPDFPQAMAKLCAKAHIIVPNLTEACLLTDTPYPAAYDFSFVESLLEKLSQFGCRQVVITGITTDPTTMGIAAMDCATGKIFTYAPPRLPQHYHGTGDLFAACCVGGLTRGDSLETALTTAADFVSKAIAHTASSPTAPWYGVQFEPALSFLTPRRERS